MKDHAQASFGALSIAGAELRSRTVGTGDPMLLLHGVPGDVDTLAPVADLLGDLARAITFSARHSGVAPGGTRSFGTGQQRDDLAEIVETVGMPVDIVAWSYAAHAALALAIDRPDMVRSLYLFEPGFPTFVSDPDHLARFEADTMAAFGPVFGA